MVLLISQSQKTLKEFATQIANSLHRAQVTFLVNNWVARRTYLSCTTLAITTPKWRSWRHTWNFAIISEPISGVSYENIFFTNGKEKQMQIKATGSVTRKEVFQSFGKFLTWNQYWQNPYLVSLKDPTHKKNCNNFKKIATLSIEPISPISIFDIIFIVFLAATRYRV